MDSATSSSPVTIILPVPSQEGIALARTDLEDQRLREEIHCIWHQVAPDRESENQHPQAQIEELKANRLSFQQEKQAFEQEKEAFEQEKRALKQETRSLQMNISLLNKSLTHYRWANLFSSHSTELYKLLDCFAGSNSTAFNCTKEWGKLDDPWRSGNKGEVKREMKFRSQAHSPLDKINIYGTRDGKLRFFIVCSKDISRKIAFQKYFSIISGDTVDSSDFRVIRPLLLAQVFPMKNIPFLTYMLQNEKWTNPAEEKPAEDAWNSIFNIHVTERMMEGTR